MRDLSLIQNEIESLMTLDISKNQEEILSTTAAMLLADEMYEAANLLRQSECYFESTGYDNWYDGTEIFRLLIHLPATTYARLRSRKDALEKQITERLQSVVSTVSDDSFSATLVPKIEKQKNWKVAGGKISRSTRQNILDGLRIEGVDWAGSLGDTEFLGRIFDLEKIPSTDSRFPDAAGDIWQHRVNNRDWTDDWVFSDDRFDLLGCCEDTFLHFLSEMVHPVVRPNRDEALHLANQINNQLHEAGWTLVERESIAGRPRFVAEQVGGGRIHVRAQSRARTVADALAAEWMHKEIQRLEAAVDQDPALAIGTAKELVESCCKTILNKIGRPPAGSENLTKISKSLVRELKLVPEGIPEQARGAKTIKILLSNFISIIKGLAELRGLYGSGHGRDGSFRGLEPRHARLAVAAAVAFIDFATETYHRRQHVGDGK